MNEIVNKFLLEGHTLMPEMYSRQHGFTYSACGPFAKNKERKQKFKEGGDLRFWLVLILTSLDCFSMIWLMETLKI